MALPSSGQISLGDIAGEYGGSAPHQLSEYHGKGNAPASGEIKIGAHFHGTSNIVITWNTAAGDLGTVWDQMRPYKTFTLSASANVGGVTYSVVSGSSGGSLNSSTGVISNFSSTGSDVTSTFTVRATSTEAPTIYEDRSFTFVTKTPPAADLLKKALGVEKGSGSTGKETAGTIGRDKLREIAEIKAKDLSANSVEQAEKIIAGTARSMGIKVE